MKVVVVTGGSRGIGLQTIKRLLKAGHRVINISRNTPEISSKDFGEGQFQHISADLQSLDRTSIQTVFSEAGRIDVLFNNAGKLINKPFLQLNQKDFQVVYQTNVFAIAELIQIAFDFFTPSAHIVNVSSIGGICGSQKFPGLSAYASSKGAVTILTECLQAEFEHTGLSFNGLAFGAVQTEMLSEAFPGYKASMTAEEMSEFVCWFLLEGNNFFKGKVLPVSITNP